MDKSTNLNLHEKYADETRIPQRLETETSVKRISNYIDTIKTYVLNRVSCGVNMRVL